MRNFKILLMLSAAACSSGALAQDASSSDEDRYTDGGIVVTATRREQALQDVPLAVTAVSASQLDDRNIRGLADIASGVVPGLQIAPFAGSVTTLAISARGIAIEDPSQGTQELAVPLYLDGVPLGRAQGLGLELVDPERIEFLRGPQGQLFGRNAQGGAIQFVSRRPSGELGVDARFQVGNFGLDSQRLRVDLPEFANIRLQGTIARTQRDAMTENPGPGTFSQQRGWNELDSFGFRIAAEWNPSDALRVNYAYDNSDVDDTQGYLTWLPVDIRGRPPFSPQPAFDGNFPRVANSPTFHEGFNTKASGHALTVQYEASENITLKSITSYRETSRNGSGSLADALVAGVRIRPPSPAPLILTPIAREDLVQDQFYQEVQFLGSWDRLDLTVGATYYNENVDDQRRSLLQGPGLGLGTIALPPGSFDPFAGCLGAETCQVLRTEQEAETDSYGIYGQATYTPPILGDRLDLTFGIRYTDDRKVANRTFFAGGLPGRPEQFEQRPSGPLPPQGVFEERRWDPAFVIKYNFTDAVNAYFRYATAYRAGGVNVRSTAFQVYDAEDVETFELGLKSRLFGNRLTFNVALYQNNVGSRQFNIPEAPTVNPSLTTTLNGIETFKIRGLEVETALRITSDLSISANYSYIDAPEFFEFDNPLTPVVDVTRFFTVQVPEHSGNIAADYNRDIGIGTLRLHADYSFASKHHITSAGQLVASFGPNYERPQAEVSMLNARAAIGNIDIGGSTVEFALFGSNLLNEANVTYAFDGAAAGGGFAQFLQLPRTYGAELRFQF
jgi:iron complex outermembrane recepter protein